MLYTIDAEEKPGNRHKAAGVIRPASPETRSFGLSGSLSDIQGKQKQ